MGSTRQHVLTAIFVACVLNFILFWLGAVYFGGDALSGGIQNGHYLLSSHGRRTEVSHAVFVYSWWHTLSVFITHPLAFICGFLWARDRKKYAKPVGY